AKATAMLNAFAANRQAERACGKPSRRIWMPANRHAEHGCQQTVMLNLIQHLLIQHPQIRIHSADSESSSE
ncbi:MAG: hypothetical protein IIU30_12105, partial [Treponema sp.]|nr:hypothetical protein [Treponema sp.]MBQ5449320.1 hypothetical protein [Treponema sp.]